jgi:hypothetical protein
MTRRYRAIDRPAIAYGEPIDRWRRLSFGWTPPGTKTTRVGSLGRSSTRSPARPRFCASAHARDAGGEAT